MYLPIQFPSETDVTLDDIARFRALRRGIASGRIGAF